MQRRTSKAGVVTATCLLILVSISPVFADIGVRAAPRPSSDPSDTAEKASSLREAQPRSTQTGSYRNGQLIVDAQPREIKPRAVAFDGPGAALDPPPPSISSDNVSNADSKS